MNEANVQNRQSQLDLAKARLKTGVGLPADVVTAETALSSSVLSLNQVQNSAELAHIDMATALGVNPRTPIALANSEETAPNGDDLAALEQQALEQHPAMAVANATEGVRIAVGSYRAGVGQFLDIINAQADLLSANTDQVNAQIAVQQARASMHHAVGIPLANGS